MDKKFHINSNGDVKVCAATKNACQFGDGSLHFSDAAEARKVAEQLLSAANGNSKVLSGKKASLSALQAKATEKKTSAYDELLAAQKTNPVLKANSFEAQEDAFVKRVAGRTHREVYIEDAPREVEQLFQRSLQPNETLRTLLKDRNGDYKAVTYSAETNEFRSLVAPPTKDIPIHMRVTAGMNMSLHPRGPKLDMQCFQCGGITRERLGNFPIRRPGDFRIRCVNCGQLGKLAITYDSQ